MKIWIQNIYQSIVYKFYTIYKLERLRENPKCEIQEINKVSEMKNLNQFKERIILHQS